MLTGEGSKQQGTQQCPLTPHLSRCLLQLLLQLLDTALQLVQVSKDTGTLLLQPLRLLGPGTCQLLVLWRGLIGMAQCSTAL